MASRLDEILRREEQERIKKKAARRSADPLVSVEQIQECLQNHLKSVASDNLWSLLAPPLGCPQRYSFKSRPSAMWMLRCAGLMYDLIKDCVPNGKIASTKLAQAMEKTFALSDDKEPHGERPGERTKSS